MSHAMSEAVHCRDDVRFPRWVRRVTGLDAGAKLVLEALWSFAPWSSGEAATVWPTAPTLADELAEPLRTVEARLARLVKVGLISRTTHHGRPAWLLAWSPGPTSDCGEDRNPLRAPQPVAAATRCGPDHIPLRATPQPSVVPPRNPLRAEQTGNKQEPDSEQPVPEFALGAAIAVVTEDPATEAVERILAAQHSAVVEARAHHGKRSIPPPRGQVRERMRAAIRGRLAEGHTEAECLHVVAVSRADWLADAKGLEFATETPWRPSNFGRLLGVEPSSRGSPRGSPRPKQPPSICSYDSTDWQDE